MPRDSQRLLRRKAEEQLRREPANDDDVPTSTRELVHELQVHHVELRMQNDALRDAQHELEVSRARYRELFELAPVAYLSLDTEGRIVDANVAAVALLGRGKRELAGKSFAQFLDPSAAQTFERHRRAVVQGEGPCGCELVLVASNGARRELRLESTATSRAADWRMALIDITEMRALSRKLTEAQRLEAVGTLASGIAHDFNNLLMAVLGCAEIALARMNAANPGRPPVEQLRDVALRGRSVVAQLLTFARSGGGAPTVIDLNSLVANSEALLGQLLGQDVQLTLELLAPDARIWADAGQLEQILFNLASNARHAMFEGGRLRIETRLVAAGELPAAALTEIGKLPCVLLSVSDTGTGMTPEVRARVFEPFFTTKPPGKGSGLGLSMVYGAVKQAGGYIELHSRAARGTTFHIYWPLAESGDAPERLGSPAHPVASERSGTVLVVEDDRLVRLVIRHYLERAGYDVLEAESGEDALALVRAATTGSVRLLVSDVVLPGMKGPQLVAEVKRSSPEIGVLLISAHEPELLVERGWLQPGTALLRKPFTPEELQAALSGMGLRAASARAI